MVYKNTCDREQNVFYVLFGGARRMYVYRDSKEIAEKCVHRILKKHAFQYKINVRFFEWKASKEYFQKCCPWKYVALDLSFEFST